MAQDSRSGWLAARRWYVPMVGRRPDEAHRAATPLELFFDLCFVVAVAFAAQGLHRSLVEDDLAEGFLDYLFVFFAIWWAWMNFTWFASAYDADDVLYRVTTMVQIAGALILAAGVPRAMEHDDFGITVSGYVVMRLALVTQWLRVALGDRPRRKMALRFALGVAFLQVGWVLRLLTDSPFVWTALPLIAGELLVPVWAEQAANSPWHFEHIVERYGLFNIIMLGESILAGTIAFQVALDAGVRDVKLLELAVAGVLIVFSMWWLYFDRPEHRFLTGLGTAFIWGYGHLFIFGAAAAVGVAIEASVDFETDGSQLSRWQTGLAVAVPVAVYVLGVWMLHLLRHLRGPLNAAFPLCAALLLGAAFTPFPVQAVALLLVLLVALIIIRAPEIEAGARSHEDG